MNVLIGLGFFAFAVVALIFFGVLAWVIIRRSNAVQKVGESAATLFNGVDFTDGIDAKELEIIKSIFSKQKKAEDEAAVKERMLKAVGQDVTS